GDDEAAASVEFHEPPERRIRHARHRRKGKRRLKLDAADFHGTTISTFSTFSTIRTISTSVSVRLHVCRVDSDANGLANQIDGEYQPRVCPLARQPADDPLQRTVNHFDDRAFADERTGIVLQIAFDQTPDGVD